MSSPKRRYTRKLTQTQRVNPSNDLTVSLHRMLNRVDAEKDAFLCETPIIRNANLFRSYANKLFGSMPKSSYTESLNYIYSVMQSFEAHDSREILIRNYTKTSSLEFLPSEIKYGIQDAGISPLRFRSDLRLLITPGSYMDPASRQQGATLCGFNRGLDERTLLKIGMPFITRIEAQLQSDKTCMINILIKDRPSISVLFGPDFRPVSGQIQYFMGNKTKNTYIDSSSVSELEASNYIICKELGDTLQAVYGKLCQSIIIGGEESLCLFTNDSILALRSKLLQLQVVFNMQQGKIDRIFYHYPVMTNITDSFIDLWKKNLQAHNTSVIKGIQDMILEGSYLLISGGKIVFKNNSIIMNVLVKYMRKIKTLTQTFMTINPYTMTIEEYQRKIYMHQKPYFFIGSVLNTIILSLPEISDVERNALMTGDDGRGMRGGGALPEYIFDREDDNYTVDREYDDSDMPYVRVGRALFVALREKYTGDSVSTLCHKVESISSMLYLYFNYMGITSYEDMLIDWIVREYDSGQFGKQTVKEFEAMYNEMFRMTEPVADNASAHMSNTVVPILNTAISVGGGGASKKRKTRKRRYIVFH
jgi:hypothetical protein